MPEETKKIMVYFNNGNRAAFDIDKVTFMRSDGNSGVFSFDNQPNGEEVSFANILKSGSLVNWANVCFVREWEPKSVMDEL